MLRILVVIAIGLTVGFVIGKTLFPDTWTLDAEPEPDMTDPMSQDVDTMELSIRYACSSTDRGEDVIPPGALVWRGDHVEHVSCDEGGPVGTWSDVELQDAIDHHVRTLLTPMADKDGRRPRPAAGRAPRLCLVSGNAS